MANKRAWLAAILFLVVFLGAYLSRRVVGPTPYQIDQGLVFGTTYKMVYQNKTDLQPEIEAELKKFDASLSPFNEQSVIARVNRNDRAVELDDWFVTVFNRSKEIFRLTEGAFDPTVSPLINLWGFGFKKKDDVTPEKVDSLLPLVGMDKIELREGRVDKQDDRMTLDFSAIAKGFACDVVGEFLKKRGVKNYMVEIGGEVVTAGVNAKGLAWRVAISRPEEDTTDIRTLQYKEVIALSGKAMATSGNYRNFYYQDGKRIAHTIDPASGYPIEHSLLSATVIADDCMTADAYATAFMVLGLERSMQLAEKRPDIDVYFICDAGNDLYEVAMTPGMRRYIQP